MLVKTVMGISIEMPAGDDKGVAVLQFPVRVRCPRRSVAADLNGADNVAGECLSVTNL